MRSGIPWDAGSARCSDRWSLLIHSLERCFYGFCLLKHSVAQLRYFALEHYEPALFQPKLDNLKLRSLRFLSPVLHFLLCFVCIILSDARRGKKIVSQPHYTYV